MINQDDLLQKYDDKRANYFLVDVRTEFEFEQGHLPGSINIPINQLEQRLKEIPADEHIITICTHGVRSGGAEEYLHDQGYVVDSLEGGLSIWKGQIIKS